jgi:hypothetical protein
MFIPHRKLLRASTACYGDRYTFLYVDDVRTSQETHLRGSTAFYGDRFTYLLEDCNQTEAPGGAERLRGSKQNYEDKEAGCSQCWGG